MVDGLAYIELALADSIQFGPNSWSVVDKKTVSLLCRFR